MPKLTWDGTGNRKFETGVDHGVLYIPSGGKYTNGVAWNGLSTVTETPSGAEANAVYADNMKYLNLISVEEFGGTIEAYYFPDEFIQFDGGVQIGGVTIGQQSRPQFGLSYRTRIGSDIEGDNAGYKLHLVYGCQASPSERAYASVNDSPEAMTFSWEFSTTAVNVNGHKPTSLLTIDSTKVTPANLATLEAILYGDSGNPMLPTPDEVLAIFAGPTMVVTPGKPTMVANVITIPSTAHVIYTINGEVVSGTVELEVGDNVIVVAIPEAGYYFPPGTDNDWQFTGV